MKWSTSEKGNDKQIKPEQFMMLDVFFSPRICLLVGLQKVAAPPEENPGANTVPVSSDRLADPALIIKDRPVSARLTKPNTEPQQHT